MASREMVNAMLAAAWSLLDSSPKSAAFRRRAVSTAYYAVFHKMAKLCAEALLPDASRNDLSYQRVYRALDHGPLTNALAQSPLKDHAVMKTLGPLILRLKEERHRADYSSPDKALFPLDEAEALLNDAEIVIHLLDQLQPSDRQLLATCLLFKERKS